MYDVINHDLPLYTVCIRVFLFMNTINTINKTGDTMKFNDAYNKILTETDYRGSHQSTGKDFAAPAHKLDKIYPDDIYGSKAVQYYGGADIKLDTKAINILHKLRDKPEAMVTIYRAIPKDIDDKDSVINDGDWVAITKEYAIEHGKSHVNNKYKIIQKKVKAQDIYTDGDSFQEFAYHK